MTFEEILPIVKAGGKVRRAVWANVPTSGAGAGGRLLALEMVQPTVNGRQIMPLLAVDGYVDGHGEGVLRPFSGANWDILADDWEVV